jgi:MinD superfamily P-loop ATPase
LAKKKVLCDADVDAADLHLVLDPEIIERHDFQAGHRAVIIPDKCTQCGICREACRWKAIGDDFIIDPIECEGCGVCFHICPEGAVDFSPNTCGEWFISKTRFGLMAHARLGIAEENSGKLVARIRQEGKKLAERHNLDLLITDGPPGVGCPVIASIGGASALLIVAEPTVSGRHDMERVVELADHFRVPVLVCINKFDLNLDQTEAIEGFARKRNAVVLGRIPFDPSFTRAMVEGKTIVEYDGRTPGCKAVKEVWKNLEDRFAL